jgi:adenylate cyclase
MLTGERPFTGEQEESILYKLLNEAPPPMRDLRSDIPLELECIVDRALAKDPAHRYQQVADLLIDLKEADLGLTVPKPSQHRPRSSIAVLPFVNMSGDPEFEYFTDGLAEELINALTHVSDLRVMARTSAFSFKGKELDVRSVGRKLNVAAVLEGSVRKAGDRLRITAQLINVVDGYHLWSQRYDRAVGDIFEIQDDISMAIVEKLKVHLAGEEKEKLVQRHTDNLEAYNLYLRGRFFFSRATGDDLNRAIHFFNRAIEADPNYALAYATTAFAYATLGHYYFMHQDEAFPKAKATATKALELSPLLSDARAALAYTQILYDWDWDIAERTSREALTQSPNSLAAVSSVAALTAITGRLAEGLEFLRRAVDLDPLSIQHLVPLGLWHLRTGHIAEAREQFHKVLELEPNHPHAMWLLGQAYIAEGAYDQAIQSIKEAEHLSKGFPPIVAALGWTYASAGRTEEARGIYAELQKRAESEYIRPFLFAKLHAAFGEIDQAFEWLNKAHEERDAAMVHILTDESIETLRSDPRYMEIVKKMKLDRYVLE